MKTRLLGFLVCLLLISGTIRAADVNSIDFEVKGDTSVISIKGSAPLNFTRQDNPQDNQIVIDLGGAKLKSAAKRKLDTSSFNSVVSLVSPYSGNGQSRVVIQLRKPATADVNQEGNTVQIRIPNAAGGSTSTPEASNAAATPSHSTQPENPELLQFENNLKTQVFTGAPITLKVRDADVRDVLRLIGETSGFNMVISSEVTGKITLSLEEVPWDQALDVVLQTMKLGAERNKNILRILALDNLTREKQSELQAKLASESNAPRITKVYPVSYADPNDMVKLLKTFGKSGMGGPSASSSQGSVDVDVRTNSIIVQDIADNIDRMTKLIELLDTQTPQVIIEAKVIEVNESNRSSFTGSLGIGSSSFSPASYGFNFNNHSLPTLPIPTGGDGGLLGNIQPNVASIPGNLFEKMSLSLSMQELENKIKIVSSPRVVVLNKRPASILQTTPVATPVNTNVAGVVTSTLSFQDAKVSLDVTPTITNDEGVLLDLKISRDNAIDVQTSSASGQGVGHRTISTQVLVDSGNTLVIGGLFTVDTEHTESGIPGLRKIPILGWFFGSESNNITRTELFVFVTPRILNIKKAGLASSQEKIPAAPAPGLQSKPSETKEPNPDKDTFGT